MIDTKSKQELLPPASESPSNASSWRDWLTDPLQKRFMIPATGLLILGLDWLLFSGDAASFGISVPLTSLVGFLLGSVGTYKLQTQFGRDSRPVASLKGLLAGIVVGLPFPILGTVAGAWILLNSGLIALKDRLLKERFSRR